MPRLSLPVLLLGGAWGAWGAWGTWGICAAGGAVGAVGPGGNGACRGGWGTPPIPSPAWGPGATAASDAMPGKGCIAGFLPGTWDRGSGTGFAGWPGPCDRREPACE